MHMHISSGASYAHLLLHLMQAFGGWNKRFQHSSKELGCDMKCAYGLKRGAQQWIM